MIQIREIMWVQTTFGFSILSPKVWQMRSLYNLAKQILSLLKLCILEATQIHPYFSFEHVIANLILFIYFLLFLLKFCLSFSSSIFQSFSLSLSSPFGSVFPYVIGISVFYSCSSIYSSDYNYWRVFGVPLWHLSLECDVFCSPKGPVLILLNFQFPLVPF